MSAKSESIVKSLLESIQSPSKETQPYDTSATVTRVEDDTVFVHIPGGVAETPCSKTIACKVGDTVQVRVGGGKAWLVGNASAPPTDDTIANTAIRKTNQLGDSLTKLQKIAGNTDQYFWHVETGEDTGSHITEIPKERFLEAPTLGGGNLLLRSNGIAIRDGLNELATFSGSAIQFNQPGTSTVVATIGTSGLYIQKGVIKLGNKTSASDTTNSGFYVDGNGNVACSNLLAHGGKIGGWNIGGSTFYAYGNENGSCSAADALGYTYVQGAPGTNLGNTVISVRTRTAAERTAGTDFSYQFYVDYKGYLYANNANIKGTITATSGTVGGWNISHSNLFINTATTTGDGWISYIEPGHISLARGRKDSSGTTDISTNLELTYQSIQLHTASPARQCTIYPGTIEILQSQNDGAYKLISGDNDIALYCSTGGARGLYAYSLGRYLIGWNSAMNCSVFGAELWLYSETGGTIRFGHDTQKPIFQPQSNGTMYLGTSTLRWAEVYCTRGAFNGSDLKEKEVINDFDWKIDDFISGLKPIAFRRKYDDGSKSTRISLGFGAQDVAKLAKDLDVGDLRLYEASIVDKDEEGNKIEKPYHGEDIDDSKLSWSLGYTELIAPMVMEIQRLMHRVNELEARLNG